MMTGRKGFGQAKAAWFPDSKVASEMKKPDADAAIHAAEFASQYMANTLQIIVLRFDLHDEPVAEKS